MSIGLSFFVASDNKTPGLYGMIWNMECAYSSHESGTLAPIWKDEPPLLPCIKTSILRDIRQQAGKPSWSWEFQWLAASEICISIREQLGHLAFHESRWLRFTPEMPADCVSCMKGCCETKLIKYSDIHNLILYKRYTIHTDYTYDSERKGGMIQFTQLHLFLKRLWCSRGFHERVSWWRSLEVVWPGCPGCQSAGCFQGSGCPNSPVMSHPHRPQINERDLWM